MSPSHCRNPVAEQAGGVVLLPQYCLPNNRRRRIVSPCRPRVCVLLCRRKVYTHIIYIILIYIYIYVCVCVCIIYTARPSHASTTMTRDNLAVSRTGAHIYMYISILYTFMCVGPRQCRLTLPSLANIAE